MNEWPSGFCWLPAKYDVAALLSLLSSIILVVVVVFSLCAAMPPASRPKTTMQIGGRKLAAFGLLAEANKTTWIRARVCKQKSKVSLSRRRRREF